MGDPTRVENQQFENEVRRIARALWPSAEFSGAAIMEGREIDGIFETEDVIHIVEATTSRRKEKAQQDITKLNKMISENRKKSGTRAVRGWFITRDEPTAEQRKFTEKYRANINTLSFSQFQARLVDSNTYLDARSSYHFGSVRDPATGALNPEIEYIPIDLIEVKSKEIFSYEKLVSSMSSGNILILLGDYGAGKSMTLREVYHSLRKQHLKGEARKFPVYLNLRDHYGQRDVSEIIRRHADLIGFSPSSNLVRAWRAGYVHLLIDGFDEISAISIQGLWHDLRDNRYRAMEGVRKLIHEHHRGAGLLLAGRAHFFNSPTERHTALRLPSDCIELSLTEFTQTQVDTYLKKSGLSGFVPSWLPSRPLLVGYLASKGVLSEISNQNLKDERIMNPTIGWDILLDSIAEREAVIEAGIHGSMIRRILERLATKARAPTGLGPLSSESIIQTFVGTCGHKPDEREMVLLQRLPGLGVDRKEENTRIFVDETFADACKAGDIVEFVRQPFDDSLQAALTDVESAVGHLAIELAAYKAEKNGFTENKINAVLDMVARKDSMSYIASDIVRLLLEMGLAITQEITLNSLLIPELELDSTIENVSKLHFRNCYFYRLELDSAADIAKIPSFYECFIDELEGRVSQNDLPSNKFDNKCHIDKFAKTAETTAEVLMLDLPLGIRVCLTILKKLYEQKGAGRRENALYRGLDDRSRRLVPDVLQVLLSEGMAFPDKSKRNVVWRPSRNYRARVARIIGAPTISKDSILQRCETL